MKKYMEIKEIKNSIIISSEDTCSVVLKYNPPNIELLSEEDKLLIIDGFAEVINMYSNVRILCVSEDIDMRKNISDLEKLNINDNMEQLRNELIHKYSENSFEQKDFYLVYSNINREEARDIISTLTANDNITETSIRKIEKLMYSSLNKDGLGNEFLFLNGLDSILPNKITETSTNYKIDQKYVTYLKVKNFPAYTKKICMLVSLMTLKYLNLCITINDVDNVMIQNNLSNRLTYTKSQSISTKINELDKSKMKAEYELLLEFSNLLIEENNKILSFDINFEIVAASKKDLVSYKNQVLAKLGLLGIKADELYFRQKEGLDTFIPTRKVNTNLNLVNSSLNISALYPFVNTTLIQENGIYIGKSISKYNPGIIMPNLFSPIFSNPNVVVLGASGEGKSVLMKKILLQSLRPNTKIFVFDSENNEYLNVRKNIGGVTINPNDISINIFELSDNVTILINEITNFIEIYAEEIEEATKRDLEFALFALFEKFEYGKYDVKDGKFIQSGEATKTPNFKDLLTVLEIIKKSNGRVFEGINIETKDLINIIRSLAKGNNSTLFTGSTNLEIQNDNKMIHFDISEIVSYPTNIYQSILYLYFEYIWKYITNPANKNEMKYIAIDELYLILNKKNVILSTILKEKMKRIRKYLGAFLLGTQQIKDLDDEAIRTEAQALLTNPAIKFIYNTREEKKFVSSLLNISDYEATLISRQKKLECFCIFNQMKYQAKVEILQTESEMMGDVAISGVK